MTSKRSLRIKLHETALQLQILEAQKGWHYMMGSRLRKEFEAMQAQHEKIMEDRKAQ